MGLDQDLYALPVGTSLDDSRVAFGERLKVRETILYWRKNYPIDAWFKQIPTEVNNEDLRVVSFEKLMELKTACQVIIANLNNIKRAMPDFLHFAMDLEDFEMLKIDLKHTEEVLSGLEDNPDVIYIYVTC